MKDCNGDHHCDWCGASIETHPVRTCNAECRAALLRAQDDRRNEVRRLRRAEALAKRRAWAEERRA
jgi:predicted nucleic acid-binding Zn ribbon protein